MNTQEVMIFSTKEELKRFIALQERIFDQVRLVDVKTNQVYYLDEEKLLSVTPHQCFEFWNREEKCQNCSSAKAFTTKGQVCKYEFVDSHIYFIISKYIEVEEKRFVLEMISKSNDETFYAAQGQNKMAKILTKLNQRIYTDSLTKAFNRAYYDEQVKGMLSKHDGVMMFDVDKFKMINDTFGHLAGDLVLKELTNVILSMTRKCDSVIRYGGDEFLVVFRDISEMAFKKRLYQIRDTIKEIRIKDYSHIDLSISIGAIYCQKQPQKSLIKKLDKLLYMAKNDKESICFEVFENGEKNEKEN